MAQSVNEIQSEVLDVIDQSNELASFEILTENEQDQITSTSKVGILRRWVWIVAVIAWLQQKIQDTYFTLVNTRIADTQIHNRAWYRNKALDFQYGFDLIQDTDVFQNGNATTEEIEASKIIKQAAIIKRGNSALRCKVATIENGLFAAVSQDVLNALQSYFNLVGDAGTSVIPTSGDADDFMVNINIHFDPLILDDNGARLDGTNDTVVESGIKDYLQSLDFNGDLIINRLERSLEDIEGIMIADIEIAATKYGAYTYETNLPEVPNVGLINQIRTAEAGHMRLDVVNSVFNHIVFNE